MFGKVLVANRGEIAVRIVRALRELGVASVAVYSDVDREALHARLADEAYHLGPTPAAESYLNVERLIEVAERSGAEAVHPGYGFLAESAAFARAVAEAGLTWIGPHPEAIEAMGSKVESRRIMGGAGVPITPGTEDPIDSAEAVREFAAEHGYPVAIKASAGGGGKGFAVARDKTEAEAAFERASREGEAYFGDGYVYLEQLPAEPQARGDPGPARQARERRPPGGEGLLDPAQAPEASRGVPEPGHRPPRCARRWGGRPSTPPRPSATITSARSSSWSESGEAGDEFFFLEMNTRVQVEHPVTEEVTGIDIVQAGVRIAAGEELPFSQEDVSWRGHAIEARLNAEDPARDFAPSPGDVTTYEEPGGPGVRVDSSLNGPGTVPESYDPLFAKLIVRGADRADALRRLRRALAEFRVEGISTTLPFHRALLDDDVFVSGDYTTGFVAERMSSLSMEAATVSRPCSGGREDRSDGRGRGKRQALPGRGLGSEGEARGGAAPAQGGDDAAHDGRRGVRRRPDAGDHREGARRGGAGDRGGRAGLRARGDEDGERDPGP